MVAYHVHEKAIMTAIIPLAMLIQHEPERRLFLRMNALGLVGLFPLLFRPVELPLKLLSYIGYMAYVCSSIKEPTVPLLDLLGMTMLAILVAFVEFIHPLCIYPRMEFLPLLLTSVTCAVGLIFCWGNTWYLIIQSRKTEVTS